MVISSEKFKSNESFLTFSLVLMVRFIFPYLSLPSVPQALLPLWNSSCTYSPFRIYARHPVLVISSLTVFSTNLYFCSVLFVCGHHGCIAIVMQEFHLCWHQVRNFHEFSNFLVSSLAIFIPYHVLSLIYPQYGQVSTCLTQ